MRVLLVTKLFPNALEPVWSVYNRHQYGELGKLCPVEVLAVIPWFPGATFVARWSHAGRLGAVPEFERIADLPVAHPRFPIVPLLHSAGPALLAASLWRTVRAKRDEIDVLVGSNAYPDGVACVWLGRLLGIPTVVQALGSDLNVTPRSRGPRRILSWTLPRADRVVTVARSLTARAIELGAPPARTVTIPNGVDTRRFRVRDRRTCREQLGLSRDAKWIVFVGNVIESKGVLDLLAAFEALAPEVPDARLAIVGDGAALGRCRELALRLPDRVFVAGARANDEVAVFMGAADVCTLPSWREGTPNVVLEALASGRRVVATRVGGIPDVITSDAHGELVEPRDVAGLAGALRRALAPALASRDVTKELVSWEESARLLHDVLADVVAEHRSRRRAA